MEDEKFGRREMLMFLEGVEQNEKLREELIELKQSLVEIPMHNRASAMEWRTEYLEALDMVAFAWQMLRGLGLDETHNGVKMFKFLQKHGHFEKSDKGGTWP